MASMTVEPDGAVVVEVTDDRVVVDGDDEVVEADPCEPVGVAPAAAGAPTGLEPMAPDVVEPPPGGGRRAEVEEVVVDEDDVDRADTALEPE